MTLIGGTQRVIVRVCVGAVAWSGCLARPLEVLGKSGSCTGALTDTCGECVCAPRGVSVVRCIVSASSLFCACPEHAASPA